MRVLFGAGGDGSARAAPAHGRAPARPRRVALPVGAGRGADQIWSATLQPRNIGHGEGGCDNNTVAGTRCSETGVLSDDDFNYGGIDYAFTRIEFKDDTPEDTLTVEWDPDLPFTVENLTLRIGGTDFPFSEADYASDGLRRWDGLRGVSWFVFEMSMRLIETPDRSATLSGLTIENAANNAAIRFNETFAVARRSYTASVANSVTQITVKPTKYDGDATIAYLDASNSPIPDVGGKGEVGPQVQLRLGSNTIKVLVTGDDGIQTYTIEVLRRQHISCRRSSADWCSMMAVEAKTFDARPAGTFYGYRAVGRYGDGLLDDDIIEYRDPEQPGRERRDRRDRVVRLRSGRGPGRGRFPTGLGAGRHGLQHRGDEFRSSQGEDLVETAWAIATATIIDNSFEALEATNPHRFEEIAVVENGGSAQRYVVEPPVWAEGLIERIVATQKDPPPRMEPKPPDQNADR